LQRRGRCDSSDVFHHIEAAMNDFKPTAAKPSRYRACPREARYYSCAPAPALRPMTRLLLFCALAAFSIAPAVAGSFAGSSAGAAAAGSSASWGWSSGDGKGVLQARADAAGFVASNGRIRGAMLEAALRHL